MVPIATWSSMLTLAMTMFSVRSRGGSCGAMEPPFSYYFIYSMHRKVRGVSILHYFTSHSPFAKKLQKRLFIVIMVTIIIF